MVIKLGINGFGRIGRVIFRAGFNKANVEILAINDPAIDIEYICYLIKFDSTHGKFNGCVTHTKDEIYVDENRIKIFHEKLPSSVPWQTAGVEYVIEASGMFTSLEKASGHLAGEGVKRVIVTAPSVDVPMVILGVNQDKINAGQKVVSCASSTLYCLAPVVKVLDDSFGVAEGFITSIHAMTPSLKQTMIVYITSKLYEVTRVRKWYPARRVRCTYCLAPIVKVLDDSFGVAEGFITSIHAMTPSLKQTMIVYITSKLYEEQKVVSCASSTLYCLAPVVKVLDDSFGVAEGFIASIHAMTPSLKQTMIVYITSKLYEGQKVVSCASSTLYCLAPVVKVLDDSFGVAEGFITSIHAMTPSLKPLDGLCLRGRHWRDHRSIHQNIIPATTGACKALGRILPRVKDKLSGLAFRVPIVNVSVLDLTIRLNSNTTLHDIFKAVETASNGALQNIIKISRDEAVSSDFIGESHSCILDADSSLQLKPNFYKLVCWYENEYSYACRVLDSIFFLEKQTQIELAKIEKVKINLPKHDNVQQTDSCKKDVLCSASQDTGIKNKQQSRLLMLRKPVSSHNSGTTKSLTGNKDTKKRSDISKVWNDEKESMKPLGRQNRSSFFHSCVAIGPQNEEEIECIKAHERLEMLKMEFTKMVNITENLLKKSYVNIKPENQSLSKKDINKSANILPDTEEIQNSCETFTEFYGSVHKSSNLFDMSGDYRFSEASRNSNVGNKTEELNSSETRSLQFQTTTPKKNKYEYQKKLVILDNETKDKLAYKYVNPSAASVGLRSAYTKSNRFLPDKIIRINDDTSEGTTRDTNLEIKDNSPLNVNVQRVQRCLVGKNKKYEVNEEHNMLSIIKQNKVLEPKLEKDKLKWKTRIGTSDSGFFSLFKKNSNTEVCGNNNVMKGSFSTANDNDNMSTEANKLVESKINVKEVIDSNKINDRDNIKTENVVMEELVTKGDENLSALHTDKNIEQKCLINATSSSPEQNLIESDHTSKCGSPDNTSIIVSNSEVKYKQDIYDKLDSVSGTDSNNSFQIHERKSQIINISDLTSSLEDLARLDKICKIIEISDELSDKLFSALDNSEGVDVKRQRWSFKDLCERIKLDDFCEKIFGKTSS